MVFTNKLYYISQCHFNENIIYYIVLFGFNYLYQLRLLNLLEIEQYLIGTNFKPLRADTIAFVFITNSYPDLFYSAKTSVR